MRIVERPSSGKSFLPFPHSPVTPGADYKGNEYNYKVILSRSHCLGAASWMAEQRFADIGRGKVAEMAERPVEQAFHR
jgi:hypothetical protein